jgi:hypothetical protein
MFTNGFTFQPCPSSRATSPAVPSSKVAIPPLPFSPVKFSGLIDRVSASERRNRLPIPIFNPLYDPELWEYEELEIKNARTKITFFIVYLQFGFI